MDPYVSAIVQAIGIIMGALAFAYAAFPRWR